MVNNQITMEFAILSLYLKREFYLNASQIIRDGFYF